MGKIVNFIIKYSIYGLVFLMPLFWLPWTLEVYEFNKQYLLVFLVGLSFIAWIFKMAVVQKKVVFKRTPLDFWILAFMAATSVSAAFSLDKISSWLGFYGRFSDSAIFLLALSVMYFVVVNNVSIGAKKGLNLSLKGIINTLLYSSGIAVIASYLSVFNIWSRIPELPPLMARRSFNPVSGSLEGLSIFLVFVVSLVIGLLLIERKENSLKGIKTIENVIHYGLVLSSLILIIMIDFRPAWISLGIVMLILLAVCFWTRILKEKVNLLFLPIVLLIISAIGVFTGWIGVGMQTAGLIAQPLPQEIILDNQTAKSVAWQSLKSYPVLGSGQGTFLFDFAKFKPVEFNQSAFWNIRFDKAPSHMLEVAATAGILGILSYASLLFVFLLVMLIFLSRIKRNKLDSEAFGNNSASILVFSLIFSWLALLTAQFFYPENSVLYFFFWFMMALIIVVWQKAQGKAIKKIKFSFKQLPEVGLVMNIILLILFFGLLSLFYLGGRFYLAETTLTQPVETDEQAIQNIEKAVNFNKYRTDYRTALSRTYLISAWTEANKSEEERNGQLLQALASGAIQQSRFAITLSPNSVIAWENLARIYRDSRMLVGGTLPFALDAYAKAVELEPTNPLFYRELCRLNLMSEEKDWDKTVKYCQRAIELKENYLDAHLQLALVYEEKGELEEALKYAESALVKIKGVSFQRGSRLAGAATEIYFQLGRLHFNLDRIDKAISMFEQAVIITPEYANGHYALGLSYQAKGRGEDALIQFKLVDQLSPGNKNIQQLIQQLESSAAQPPAEEE
jgi:putative inorganic carbon (hco3(-)) transporter